MRRTVRAADEDPGVEGRRLAVEPVRDAEAAAVHAQPPRGGVALLAVSLVRAPHGLRAARGWSRQAGLVATTRPQRANSISSASAPTPSRRPHRVGRVYHGSRAPERKGAGRNATFRIGLTSLNLGPRSSWPNRAYATRRAKRGTAACCVQSRSV